MPGPATAFSSSLWVLLVYTDYQCHRESDGCQDCEDECLQGPIRMRLLDWNPTISGSKQDFLWSMCLSTHFKQPSSSEQKYRMQRTILSSVIQVLTLWHQTLGTAHFLSWVYGYHLSETHLFAETLPKVWWRHCWPHPFFLDHAKDMRVFVLREKQF